MIHVIVTRHPGLVDYLRKTHDVAPNVEVIPHVTDPKQLAHKVVAGVLPLHLAAEARAVVSVDLNIPAELRGAELTAEQVERYATGTRIYRVETVDPVDLA
jgi:putative CRISPR-associated protein (TIGR02620 family)